MFRNRIPPAGLGTHPLCMDRWAWHELCGLWSSGSQAGMRGCLLHRMGGQTPGLLYLPTCKATILGAAAHGP